VDEETKTVSFESGATFKEGDVISIDGSTGFIYGEAINTVEPDVSGDFATLMGWADEIRTLKVRANADNPRDAKQAVEFGCEGIGLCRTEHMFFEEERIPAIRRMIVAETAEERKAALDIIRPFQQGDFREMYKVLGEMPMTVRLLDPPLHEFLPHTEEEIRDLAKTMNISYERLQGTVDELHELNPMLGTRGCRLAVLYPEIAEMQTEAIIGAAIEVKKECGFNIVPEIMIPLVGEARELTFVKEKVVETADRMIEEAGIEIKYMVGTTIEIPRAALTAAVPAAALMTAVPGAALMTAVIGAALPTELTGPEIPAVTPWEPAPTDLETPGQQRAGHRKAARAFIPLRDIWAVPAGVPAQVPGRETTTAETVDREDGEALIPDRIIFTKKSFLRTTFCGTESETILMRLLRRKEPVRGKGSARNGKKSSGKCISGLEPARRLPWLRSSS
jgi:hypothetical protein